jgi:hypothetical protein
VRLREEAEARAARRRHPRGPRRVKVAIEVNRAAMKPEHEPVGVPEVSREAKSLTRPHERGAVLRSKAPQSVIVQQPVSAPCSGPSADQVPNGHGRGSRWATRAAWHRAKRKGLAMPLRPGERWKRRLPKWVC